MITYETHHSSFYIGCSSNINFLPHIHHEIEVIYVSRGSLEVSVHQNTYTVNSCELALIMPHTLHGYHTPQSSEHTIAIFKPDIISYYQPLMTSRCICPVVSKDRLHPDIPTYLEHLSALQSEPNIGLIKGYLYLLFTRILPELEFIKQKDSSHDSLIHHCLDYIHLHFKEPISLDILATNLGLSSSYISRLFNKCIGYSFTYYINTLRIDYAKYLIRETSLPITQISFESGFQTLRHFNRVFKMFTGYSPHHYQSLFN